MAFVQSMEQLYWTQITQRKVRARLHLCVKGRKGRSIDLKGFLEAFTIVTVHHCYIYCYIYIYIKFTEIKNEKREWETSVGIILHVILNYPFSLYFYIITSSSPMMEVDALSVSLFWIVMSPLNLQLQEASVTVRCFPVYCLSFCSNRGIILLMITTLYSGLNKYKHKNSLSLSCLLKKIIFD